MCSSQADMVDTTIYTPAVFLFISLSTKNTINSNKHQLATLKIMFSGKKLSAVVMYGIPFGVAMR